jgi:hypothetical protein
VGFYLLISPTGHRHVLILRTSAGEHAVIPKKSLGTVHPCFDAKISGMGKSRQLGNDKACTSLVHCHGSGGSGVRDSTWVPGEVARGRTFLLGLLKSKVKILPSRFDPILLRHRMSSRHGSYAHST